MLNKRKLKILFRKYAKIIGITDPKLIERVFMRGDIYQKKRDLVAMRAVVYAKRHLKPESTPEEKINVINEFAKTQNLKDARFPKIKNEIEK